MSQVNQFVQQFMQPLKRFGNGRNPRAYTQGLTPYRQKQWQQAVECFTQATTEQPDHAPSHFKLGMSHFRLKEYEAALAAMTRALELDPSQKQWQEQLDQTARHVAAKAKQSPSEKEQTIRDQIERLDNPSAMLYNQLAHSLRKQGKWWQEVEALKSAIALEDDHPTWFYRLGEAQEVMNRYQQAAEAYGRAIELKEGEASATWHYRQGYCFAREGHDGPADQQAAESAFAAAIEKDTKLNAQRFGIGVFHQQRGYWPQARKAYYNQLKKQTWDAELNYRAGMASDRCYEWADAEACFINALTIDKEQPYWHYRLGFVLERQEKFEQAAIAYQYAALNNEKHTTYWFYRWAYVLEKQGRYEEATQAYLQTRKQQTLDKQAEIAGSGELLKSENDITTLDNYQTSQKTISLKTYASQFDNQQFIIDALEKHLETDTINPDHWFQLGNAYERQKNWSKAAHSYQQAVMRQNEHTPNWFYRLGYSLFQLNNFKEGCLALKRVSLVPVAEGVLTATWAKTEHQKRLSMYVRLREEFPLFENLVMYESWQGSKLGCSPYAMLLGMLNNELNKKFIHVVVLNKPEKLPVNLRSRKNIIPVVRNSYLYCYYLAVSKYVINNTAFPLYFIRRTDQKYLNTWHGTPQKTLGKHELTRSFKRVNPAKNFNNATHIISPNKFSTFKILDGYDVTGSFTAQVAETGYPRIDLSLNPEIKKDVKYKLGLDSSEKVVLFAPTWRGEFQNAETGGGELEALASLAKLDATILFRGHHLTQSIFENMALDNVLFPNEEIDTNELLSIVDILITDYSSIYFDYLCLGKPIIHYIYDIEYYSKNRGLYFGVEGMPGEICYNLVDLIDKVKYLILNDDMPDFAHYQSKYTYLEDGNSTKRVIDFFFNDEATNNVSSLDERKSILIFPGHLKNNGITKSFLSVLSSIDNKVYSVTIIIDVKAVYQSGEGVDTLLELQKEHTVIGWEAGLPFNLEQRYVSKLISNNIVDSDAENVRGIYTISLNTDFERILGFKIWDYGINFGGYSPYWSELFAFSDKIKRKVIYVHNDIFEEYKDKYPSLYRVINTYKHYDSCVFVSESLMDNSFEKVINTNGHRLINADYVNNLLDPFLYEKSRQPVDEEDKKLFLNSSYKIVSIGRFSPEKNQKLLIESFSYLLKLGVDANLYILGEGPMEGQLKKLVKNLGISEKVFFIGYKVNPYPYLKSCDVFVLSSTYEGQGLVLLESLSLELPCVSTNIPGPQSVLSNNRGLLVSQNHQDLAMGIKKILDKEVIFSPFSYEKYNGESVSKFKKVVLLENESD